MSRASDRTITTAPPATPPTSRRKLLAGSGLGTALAIIGLPAAAAFVHGSEPASALPASHPDAALLVACTASMAARHALYAVPDEALDAEHAAALDRYHETYEVVDGIRPRSLVGLKNKTRVMMDGFEMQAAPNIGSTVENSAEWHELGVWRLMQDVLALDGAA